MVKVGGLDVPDNHSQECMTSEIFVQYYTKLESQNLKEVPYLSAVMIDLYAFRTRSDVSRQASR